jgi:hypothetical protein
VGEIYFCRDRLGEKLLPTIFVSSSFRQDRGFNDTSTQQSPQ